MDLFNVIVGFATIVSCIVAIKAYRKAEKVENKIKSYENISQNVSNNNLNNSKMVNVGHDYKVGSK
jgi:hypothetical protein